MNEPSTLTSVNNGHLTTLSQRNTHNRRPQYRPRSIHSALTHWLIKPGEDWAYRGGLDWCTYITRRPNTYTLEEHFNKNIWWKLDRDPPYPTFDLNKHTEMKGRLVQCAERTADGELKPGYTAFGESPKYAMGGRFDRHHLRFSKTSQARNHHGYIFSLISAQLSSVQSSH